MDKVYDHFSFMKDDPLKKIAPRKLNPYQKYIQSRFKDQPSLPEKQQCSKMILSYVQDWKKMSKEERLKFSSQQIEVANNQDQTIVPEHIKSSPNRILKGLAQRSQSLEQQGIPKSELDPLSQRSFSQQKSKKVNCPLTVSSVENSLIKKERIEKDQVEPRPKKQRKRRSQTPQFKRNSSK